MHYFRYKFWKSQCTVFHDGESSSKETGRLARCKRERRTHACATASWCIRWPLGSSLRLINHLLYSLFWKKIPWMPGPKPCPCDPTLDGCRVAPQKHRRDRRSVTPSQHRAPVTPSRLVCGSSFLLPIAAPNRCIPWSFGTLQRQLPPSSIFATVANSIGCPPPAHGRCCNCVIRLRRFVQCLSTSSTGRCAAALIVRTPWRPGSSLVVQLQLNYSNETIGRAKLEHIFKSWALNYIYLWTVPKSNSNIKLTVVPKTICNQIHRSAQNCI